MPGEDHNNDPINHPSHYNHGKIEVLDCIESMLTSDEFIGYLKGNILKYVARERYKGGLIDLKKAEFYQKRLNTFKSDKGDQ
jgi:hypothetical protein